MHRGLEPLGPRMSPLQLVADRNGLIASLAPASAQEIEDAWLREIDRLAAELDAAASAGTGPEKR
jgi:hypothetical protein